MPGLTLERIAELSGVSRSTVSRVINGHKRVSAAVRERVLKIVAETGYQPDPAAQSLANRRLSTGRAHQGEAPRPRKAQLKSPGPSN
jgi:LacI family transcriptional regulator